MGEDLFRLISTGLLAVMVLLLLLAVSQLGRLRRSLDDRTHAPAGPDPTEGGSTDDDSVAAHGSLGEPHRSDADDAAVVTSSGAESSTDVEAETAPSETVQQVDPNEEGPYEQDGRWWFRRDGELLVYDEQLERWVDANAPSDGSVAAPDPQAASAPEPVVHADPVEGPEPHPLDEAREWTAPERRETAQVPTVSGSGAESPAVSDVTSPAPVPEPVNAPAPIAEDDGSQGASAGHWKCPSCGVINGSTSASCRMCFAARP